MKVIAFLIMFQFLVSVYTPIMEAIHELLRDTIEATKGGYDF